MAYTKKGFVLRRDGLTTDIVGLSPSLLLLWRHLETPQLLLCSGTLLMNSSHHSTPCDGHFQITLLGGNETTPLVP